VESLSNNNIFFSCAGNGTEEFFESLVETEHFTLKRIVSAGQATPPGQWLDQETDEWVILLSGSAGVLFEGEDQVQVMQPGDYLHIPAYRRHRSGRMDRGEQADSLASLALLSRIRSYI
jgi:cupin 2 domain-containing protein